MVVAPSVLPGFLPSVLRNPCRAPPAALLPLLRPLASDASARRFASRKQIVHWSCGRCPQLSRGVGETSEARSPTGACSRRSQSGSKEIRERPSRSPLKRHGAIFGSSKHRTRAPVGELTLSRLWSDRNDGLEPPCRTLQLSSTDPEGADDCRRPTCSALVGGGGDPERVRSCPSPQLLGHRPSRAPQRRPSAPAREARSCR